MEFSVILASTLDHVIGIGSECLNSKIDRAHFHQITKYTPHAGVNLLIVGRKTWETIPDSMRKCPHRKYIIITRQEYYDPGASVLVASTFMDAYRYAISMKHLFYKTFIIGGQEIYQLAMETGLVTEIFLTKFQIELAKEFSSLFFVKYNVPLDTFKFIEETVHHDTVTIQYTEAHSFSKLVPVIFSHYVKVHKPFEIQYLNLISDIMSNGVRKETRNGPTLSVTDRQIKIDLEDGFPILTVRKSFWRGIKEELLWMLSGSTNVKHLQSKNIHIWDGNSSRDFLDKHGLKHLEEGDIGAGYGFQMRYSGAKYINCQTNYQGQGVDQLARCVESIKNNPNDRRIIINLWNVSDLSQMALAPCHLNYQFTVSEGKLSCHLYQRSWDVMLGWNTSTVALLTHLLAYYCDLKVGTLTHTICDAHIYECHLEAAKVLRSRMPYPLPKLVIDGVKPDFVDQYTGERLILVAYKAHDALKMSLIA